MKSIKTLKRIECVCDTIHMKGQRLAVMTQEAVNVTTTGLLKFMLRVIQAQVSLRRKALGFIVIEKEKLEDEIDKLESCFPEYEKYINQYSSK